MKCERCEREGVRGFEYRSVGPVVMPGYGYLWHTASSWYICTNRRACERRQQGARR